MTLKHTRSIVLCVYCCCYPHWNKSVYYLVKNNSTAHSKNKLIYASTPDLRWMTIIFYNHVTNHNCGKCQWIGVLIDLSSTSLKGWLPMEVVIIITGEMAVFNVAGNLKWGRRIWCVVYSFPTETNYKQILNIWHIRRRKLCQLPGWMKTSSYYSFTAEARTTAQIDHSHR